MMRNPLKDERGIALVMVLILSLIALGFVSAMLYMLTLGTRTSGAEKFYRTADSAALGGTTIAMDMIVMNFDTAMASGAGAALSAPLAGTLGTVLVDNNPPGSQRMQCLAQKLSLAPVSAGVFNYAGIWSQCTPAMYSLDPTVSADMTFTLAGLPNNYRVFAKIVDTVEGNTSGVPASAAGGLSTGGVGGGGASIVTPQRRSWMYRMEVEAENQANNLERSRYSILFAH